MDPLDIDRNLMILTYHLARERGFSETVHTLERESGIFFDWYYFVSLANSGKWDDVEKYLTAFTNLYDNLDSIRILFQIRKMKYIQALLRCDYSKALDILANDLSDFLPNQEYLGEMLLLLKTGRNADAILQQYTPVAADFELMDQIFNFIVVDPAFRKKLLLPILNTNLLQILNEIKRESSMGYVSNPSEVSDPRAGDHSELFMNLSRPGQNVHHYAPLSTPLPNSGLDSVPEMLNISEGSHVPQPSAPGRLSHVPRPRAPSKPSSGPIRTRERKVRQRRNVPKTLFPIGLDNLAARRNAVSAASSTCLMESTTHPRSRGLVPDNVAGSQRFSIPQDTSAYSLYRETSSVVQNPDYFCAKAESTATSASPV